MPRSPDLAIHLGALANMGLLDGLIAIAKENHVLLDHVFSDSRSKNVLRARTACYLHLRDKGLSYPEIGRIMMRDHTTIIHVIKKYRNDERRRAAETDDGPQGDPKGRKAS
jgi:chromosomal replication initiation ATPase DnaA